MIPGGSPRLRRSSRTARRSGRARSRRASATPELRGTLLRHEDICCADRYFRALPWQSRDGHRSGGSVHGDEPDGDVGAPGAFRVNERREPDVLADAQVGLGRAEAPASRARAFRVGSVVRVADVDLVVAIEVGNRSSRGELDDEQGLRWSAAHTYACVALWDRAVAGDGAFESFAVVAGDLDVRAHGAGDLGWGDGVFSAEGAVSDCGAARAAFLGAEDGGAQGLERSLLCGCELVDGPAHVAFVVVARAVDVGEPDANERTHLGFLEGP